MKTVVQRLSGAIIVVFLLSGCGRQNTLTIDESSPSNGESLSMQALDRLDLPPGTHVIVPTDSAFMGLDADILARVASEGGVHFLLDNMVLEEPVDLDDLDGPISAQTTAGSQVDFLPGDDGVTVGVGRLIEVRRERGLTLIVVDGLWNQ